jgi:hypothetical protein
MNMMLEEDGAEHKDENKGEDDDKAERERGEDHEKTKMKLGLM